MDPLRVLVVGKGAREHALCWRLNQSESVFGLWCAPGNPGIARVAKLVPIDATDISALVDFAKRQRISLTVVGPEDPLAAGIVDAFQAEGLKIFGPTKAAAQLESSKSFAKNIMQRAQVPTAAFATFDDPLAARAYVRSHGAPLVVKADGLALGKGVSVCDEVEQALAAIDQAMVRNAFGTAGRRVVIEAKLVGDEVSFFALCAGTAAVPLGVAQDHKQIFDGDRGPNTGGMGAYTPLPQLDAEFEARVMERVVRPVLATMAAQGTPFTGVLFVNLMLSGRDFNVLEFNARFGDPECEPLMMRFEGGDLAQVLMAAVDGELDKARFWLSPKSAVAVILASGGYPGEYRKGLPISGLEHFDGAQPSNLKVSWAMRRIRIQVFHAATANVGSEVVTDGGRVLAVTALAEDLKTAVEAAYQAAEMIDFEGKVMRHDIAAKALARLA